MELMRELAEAERLLEEGWFFGNLLIGPSNDYNTREEMSVTKSGKSAPVEDPKRDNSHLPSCMAMFHPVKENHDSGGSNWITQNYLIPEQSLPSCLKGKEEDEDEDEESDFTLGRLIRQASLNSSSILPPTHNSKIHNSGFPTKYRPRKRTDQSNIDTRDQYLSDGAKIRRSSSDIQTKQVKSFKTLSCVKENCSDKTKENITENHSPTIPNWCDNDKRSSQDMKEEIKFWARAVASNVAAPSLSIAHRN